MGHVSDQSFFLDTIVNLLGNKPSTYLESVKESVLANSEYHYYIESSESREVLYGLLAARYPHLQAADLKATIAQAFTNSDSENLEDWHVLSHVNHNTHSTMIILFRHCIADKKVYIHEVKEQNVNSIIQSGDHYGLFSVPFGLELRFSNVLVSLNRGQEESVTTLRPEMESALYRACAKLSLVFNYVPDSFTHNLKTIHGHIHGQESLKDADEIFNAIEEEVRRYFVDAAKQIINFFGTHVKTAKIDEIRRDGFSKYNLKLKYSKSAVKRGLLERYVDFTSKSLSNSHPRHSKTIKKQFDGMLFLPDGVINLDEPNFDVNKGNNDKFFGIMYAPNKKSQLLNVVICNYESTFTLAPNLMVYKTTTSRAGGFKEKITIDEEPQTLNSKDLQAVSLFNAVMVRRFIYKGLSGKSLNFPNLPK